MGVRRRIVAVVCALVLSAVPLRGPAATAQAEPVFPLGAWEGEAWFDRADSSELGLVEYTGVGEVKLEGAGDGDTIRVSGEVAFEVLIEADGPLASSQRTYSGLWDVEGWGSALEASGSVAAVGSDLAKEAGAVPTPVGFETEGRGVLTLDHVSCVSMSGTFTTEVIPAPGAIAGPALVAPFIAFPKASSTLDDLYREVVDRWALLTTWLGSPDTNNLNTRDSLLQTIRELVQLIEQLNQAIADAGLCGAVSGDYLPGGIPHWYLGRIMRDVAFIVGSANAKVEGSASAEFMIEVYGLAASLGAFDELDSVAVEVMNIYPIELEKLLADAIVDGEASTIDAIYAAAVQYGWQSLAEKADSAR